MANKQKIHRKGRDRAVTHLLDFRRDVGPLTRPIYEMAAAECGYSVRQLQRQVARLTDQENTQPGTEFKVDANVIERVFLHCGNVSAAYEDLARGGSASLPSLSTFRRRVWEAMGSSQMEFARKGPRAARINRVHLARTPECRGYSSLLDNTELPIFAVPDGHRTAQRPWLTVVMDAETRYVLSWVLTFGTPSAEEIRAGLVLSFTTRMAPDGVTQVGGLPERAIWDRGLDFLSDLVTESCLRVGVTPVALPAYSPHLKGSLERLWRFLKSNALAGLPGYIDSGIDVRGQYLLASKAMSQQELVNVLQSWFDRYNAEHKHRTLGCSPLEAWKNDPTPLRRAEPDQLWQDFMLSKNHKVGTAGIRFAKRDYVDLQGKMNHLFGRTVEVRYLPHTHDYIEVFHAGAHVATCYDREALSPDNEIEFLTARRRAEAESRRNFRTANRLRQSYPGATPIERIAGRNGSKTRYDVIGPNLDLHEDGERALADLRGLPEPDQGSLW